MSARIFGARGARRAPAWGDGIVVLVLAALLGGLVHLAASAPARVHGEAPALDAAALPFYAACSLARMLAAYALSLGFTLVFGTAAARSARTERLLVPVLDVLQSVPILSFLPVVALSLSAVFPQRVAAETASIVLIFTGQVWNLTFAWYQSLRAIPSELAEASTVFRLNRWLRFRALELPHAAITLVWNSVMSWAGGWFFLMAAESFTVAGRDYRLPGLGSYLAEATRRRDLLALGAGTATLVLVIVLLDQLAWRPLTAWAERFKLETIAGAEAPRSWFLSALRSSRTVQAAREHVIEPGLDAVDLLAVRASPRERAEPSRGFEVALLVFVGGAVVAGGASLARTLASVPASAWLAVLEATGATAARVGAALVLALAWTIPLGVLMGTRPRVAAWVQPLVEIAASVPATALFPFALALLLRAVGLSVAAVVLMLLGTQWYLLFNVIAGAQAIPRELEDTAEVLGLGTIDRWRTLILPSIAPYVVTGLITAAGGAWNASVVAEHVETDAGALETTGLGALIARASAGSDAGLLAAATLAMVVAVLALNRLAWRPLGRMAAERFAS